MDTLFTAYAGGNCTLPSGTSGYVTGFHKEGPHTSGAFVKVPVLNGAGSMLYVNLGRKDGDQRHEIASVRRIDRDEFDRLNGLDKGIWAGVSRLRAWA